MQLNHVFENLGRPSLKLTLRCSISKTLSGEDSPELWNRGMLAGDGCDPQVADRGAPRIQGELLKLGFTVAQSTVSKYMLRGRRPPLARLEGWINPKLPLFNPQVSTAKQRPTSLLFSRQHARSNNPALLSYFPPLNVADAWRFEAALCEWHSRGRRFDPAWLHQFAGPIELSKGQLDAC